MAAKCDLIVRDATLLSLRRYRVAAPFKTDNEAASQ
jgi:hypothetical protein